MKRFGFFAVIGLLFYVTFANLSKKEELVPTKTLRFYLQSEPYSLDPRFGGDRRSQIVLRELFEGLCRIDENGDAIPAIARQIDISEDHTRYTFTLRNAHWSNGEPVTADDFEYAWKSNVTPSFASPFSYAFFIIKNGRRAKLGEVSLDEVGVRALNDTTLEVELEHPAPYFLELVANPIYSPVCKTVVQKNPEWSKKAGPSYVCNGPFTLEKWQNHEEVSIKKSPTYWEKEVVEIDRMTFAIIENPQTALNMFERKKLDWVGEPFGYLPLESIPVLAKKGQLQKRELCGMCWIMFNTTHPLLSSAKIRKALSYATNRNEITSHLLQGGEQPAFSIVPRKFTLLKEPPFKDADIIQAQQLFEEGLREMNLTRQMTPPLTIHYWSDPKDRAIAETVQAQWQKTLGIHVELIPCDFASYVQKNRTGDFQAIEANWFTWYKDPIYNLEFIKYRDNSFNGTGWEHPQYITLLNQSDIEKDREKRDMLLQQAEALVAEEMPVAPLYSHTYKFAKAPFTGFYISPIGQLELKYARMQSGE